MSFIKVSGAGENLFITAVSPLFSMPAHSGKDLDCYFLVNHTSDQRMIRQLAQKLLYAGCRKYVFCGAQRPVWNEVFDDLDMAISPAENYAMTISERNIDAMSGRLSLDRKVYSGRKFLVFYDDAEAMHQFLNTDKLRSSLRS